MIVRRITTWVLPRLVSGQDLIWVWYDYRIKINFHKSKHIFRFTPPILLKYVTHMSFFNLNE